MRYVILEDGACVTDETELFWIFFIRSNNFGKS